MPKAARRSADYEVWHGDSLVGSLWDVTGDRAAAVCRFVPGRGWEAVRPLFAAQEEWRLQSFSEGLVWAAIGVRKLGVELRPPHGGEPFRPRSIYLDERSASFRG
ncbi:hypothetical protein [Kitasatospora sp. NPDC094015]|uniref:hypothetical protein n=1 Tax=Kitasatospora sp. NPDC094015 TaxID=3155205 RepID=UPI0033267163